MCREGQAGRCSRPGLECGLPRKGIKSIGYSAAPTTVRLRDNNRRGAVLPSILFSPLPHHSLHLYFTPLSTLFAFLRSVVALPTLDLTFLTSCLRLEIQFILPLVVLAPLHLFSLLPHATFNNPRPLSFLLVVGDGSAPSTR